MKRAHKMHVHQMQDSVVYEYVWLDGMGRLCSKTRCGRSDVWTFDGSSTGQATRDSSEVELHPVAAYRDPFRDNGKLLMCACYDIKGNPLPSNTFSIAEKVFQKETVSAQDSWFGLEQEYVITDNVGNLLGSSERKNHYCGVGPQNALARIFAEDHMQHCLRAGLSIAGINSEVMLGQWEYQIGIAKGIDAAHQLWISRYILLRLAEIYDYRISFAPKPVSDENGSGCHINFSTQSMRNSLDKVYDVIDLLAAKHKEHIEVYGANDSKSHNERYGTRHQRLTGEHETAPLDRFVKCTRENPGNRGASVRVPHLGKKGSYYLEDRRPASDVDPYLALARLMCTVLLDE